MKRKNKNWLLVVNLFAIASVLLLTIVQASIGATEIFAAPTGLTLTSEADLTSLQVGDEFVVTISDSREIGDIVTTKNSEVPLVDKSADILTTINETDQASVSRQWTMTLPKGISFDDAAEKTMLQNSEDNSVLPSFNYDEDTGVLDITVDAEVDKLDLKFFADIEGEYQLSVSDKNIMLTDSDSLEVIIKETSGDKAAVETVDNSDVCANDSLQVERGRTQQGFTTVPDSNGDYTNDLTYNVWGGTDNTWGTEPTLPDGTSDTSQIIHVYNFSQLNKAIRGTFVPNDGNDPMGGGSYASKNNLKYIKFMANIDNGNTSVGLGLSPTEEVSDAQAKDVVIDGNNHYLSTGVGWFRWRGSGYNLTKNSAINIYIKNMDMYSTSPYGCFSIWFVAYSSMIYENVTYTGSQLSASYLTTQVFRGTNIINSVKSFKHPSKGHIQATYNSDASSGLEGRRVYVQSGSNTTFNAAQGDGVILGAWQSQRITSNVPILHVENNATLNVNATGNGGESYGRSNSEYNSSNGTVFAAINIQNGGKLTLGEGDKGGTLNVDTSGTGRAGIRLTGGSSSRYTTVDIGKNSKINLLTNGNMGIPQSGPNGATVDDTQYQYYAGLSMYNYSRINLSGEGAELNIDMKNDRYRRSTSGMYSPGIYMGTNASVNIAGGATFNLDMEGSFGSALRMNGGGSTFNVADNGTANFIVSNQTGTTYYGTGSTLSQQANQTSDSILVYVNAGSFVIGRNGTFTMKVADGTGTRDMLYAGAGSFSFEDAKLIDLDAQANDNVRLVNMNGIFNADIQIVYAWNKGNKNTALDDRDHYWAPIYNANITYLRSGSTVTIGSITANSIDDAIEDGEGNSIAGNFKKNYNTEKFNRVLYEQVPDVNVSINKVSDNKDLEPSHPDYLSGERVSGTVNPDTFLSIYLTRKGTNTTEPLTPLTDTNQIDINKRPVEYNTKSNVDSSSYVLAIPDETTLYVGDIITVRGFRWGKEDTQTYIVVDKTGPQATVVTYYTYVNDPVVPTASDFVAENDSGVKQITDKGVEDATAATYPVTFNSGTDIDNLVSTPTGEAGVEVELDISDFATELKYDSTGKLVLDKEGNTIVINTPNTKTITAKLIVAESQTGISVKPDKLDIDYQETNQLDDAALSSHILNLDEINLFAWRISDGNREEWTKATDFTISSLGTLANRDAWAVGTPYTITISPTVTGLTDLIATTNIYIVNMNATFSIQFVTDGGTRLETYTVSSDEDLTNPKHIKDTVVIGETVDLTDVSTYQLVTDKKASLINDGYASVDLSTPAGANEKAVPITTDGQVLVYTVTGQLIIQSYPTQIDFGKLTYNGEEQRVAKPNTNNKDLVIADTRADVSNGWTLLVALSKPMSTGGTENAYLNADAVRYVKGTRADGSIDEEILEDAPKAVMYQATGTAGKFNVTKTWGTAAGSTFTGLNLVTNRSDKVGEYEGEITWTIQAGPI